MLWASAVTWTILIAPGLLLAMLCQRGGEFSQFETMLSHSPFAIATVVPFAAPDSAKNLYIPNVQCSEGGAVATIASSTDPKFKEILSTKGPNRHGFSIQFSDIQCGNQK